MHTVLHLTAPSDERAQDLALALRRAGASIGKVLPPLPGLPSRAHGVFGAARARALSIAEASAGVVVLEDEALVVPAIGGLPGPASARFAELNASTMQLVPSDLDREGLERASRAKLLMLIGDSALHERAASLHTMLVVAAPRRVLFEVAVACHGWVLPSAHGEGRAYDALFVAQRFADRTLAQLSAEVRSEVVGRRRLLDDLVLWASRSEVFP